MSVTDFLDDLDIGGLFSNDHDELFRPYESNRDAVVGRVQGALDAGVHPLYAMGAGLVGGQMKQVGNSASISARRLSDGASPEDKRLKKLEGDFIEEQIKASKAQRLQAEGGAVAYPYDEGPIDYEPVRQIIPITGKEGQAPGDHPAWYKHNLSYGKHKISLWAPVKETEELFQSPTMWPFVYGANEETIDNFIKNYLKYDTVLGQGISAFSALMDGMKRKFMRKK